MSHGRSNSLPLLAIFFQEEDESHQEKSAPLPLPVPCLCLCPPFPINFRRITLDSFLRVKLKNYQNNLGRAQAQAQARANGALD
jgi:hypothetical protein